MNYNEYDQIMESYALRFKEQVTMRPSELGSKIMVLNVNRLILNFLSSARTFFDHIERRLGHRHGKNTHEFRAFKTEISHAFDHSFAYRFLYKLRNYVQHCGMPIGSMNLTAKYASDARGQVIQVLDVLFDRDSLLADFNDWGMVEADLRRQPQFFPIRPIVEEFMSWIERFQTSLMARATPVLLDHIGALESLITEARLEEEGTAFIGIQRPDPEFSGKSTISMESFPVETIGFLRKSMKKTFGVGMTDLFGHSE